MGERATKPDAASPSRVLEGRSAVPLDQKRATPQERRVKAAELSALQSAKNKSGKTSTTPLIDRSEASGGLGRLLLVGLLLLGLAGLFLLLPRAYAQPVTVAILVVLAILGVFFLLALAIGFVHVTAKTKGDAFSRAFVDGLDHGALVTDWEGRIVYANRAYGDMTGAESVRDVSTLERVLSGADEASEIVYRMNQRVRAGETHSQEFRLVHSLPDLQNGTQTTAPHWYRLSSRLLPHSGYSKPLIVWELADVTLERSRQESVFLELQHAIDYLDHAPAGFFSAQPDGSVVYMNATLAEWLGRDLADFKPGTVQMQDFILGDGMALLNTLNVEPGQSRTAVVDLDLARSNGQSLPVRLYHKVPFAPDGAPGATRTVVLNRSAGEGNAEDLRAAEVRFTRFFNNTPIAIASFGADGAMIQSNAPFQRLFAPVLGQSDGNGPVKIEDLCGEDERPAVHKALADAIAGKGAIDHIDSVVPRLSAQIEGEDCSLRFFISTVSDGSDLDEASDDVAVRERAIVYAIEMTEQKALERQMAQSQKMNAVGQLAGGIAHDFNNVLTAIIGLSDLLLSNHRPSDPSFTDIMGIKHSANRAASLVRQLLAFSRRQTLRPQTLSVPDVLADMRMLLARLVGDNIKLEINHGRDLWPLRADIGQLEQVIVNLCVNARDAINDTPSGGKDGQITVRTSNVLKGSTKVESVRREMPDAEYVLIEVQDSGTGMSDEIMQKIFDPFFSTKEVGKGTGLGLSMVYGIVKQSGGFIYPESVVGEGTTFRIYLPRHEPSAAELQEAAADVGERKERVRNLAGNATILFVEDEDAVRAVGSRTLEARGYIVHQAENGVEAMELLEEHGDEIDLVVSDVVMPEMDGPSLLDAVRKTGNQVPFIFASGYAEDAFEKNLPEAEQNQFGFIPKPYSLKQLATVVKEVLDGED
ncbi:MAG: ATP-binding protein [Pseudomonadota bacterium]